MADGTCSIPGCIKPLRSRGWCEMHYHRWYRHGDPLEQGKSYMRGTAEERFWAKVDRQDPEGCWLWTAGVGNDGYGFFAPRHRLLVRAHRFAFELLVGPIPEGLQLDHLCRVRNCVRPSHLEPVTSRENLLRGDTLPAKWSQRDHCIRGHEYSPENTRVAQGQGRVCRRCHREYQRKYAHARKVAPSP